MPENALHVELSEKRACSHISAGRQDLSTERTNLQEDAAGDLGLRFGNNAPHGLGDLPALLVLAAVPRGPRPLQSADGRNHY